jgi:GTPase SAR1 family protein
MKSTFCLTLVLLLSVDIAYAMDQETAIFRPIAEPLKPDLMPAAGKEIIKILNRPKKYEQPDHITIIGAPGSGKTTIIERIIKSIDGTYVSCDAMTILMRLGHTLNIDESKLNKFIFKEIINPTFTAAEQEGKPKAVLVLQNFQELYNNQHKRLNRLILKALNPSDYAGHRPPLLIINESLPLKQHFRLPPIEGENIIRITPPDLPARTQLIRYLVWQRNYICDTQTQEELIQKTKGQSLAMITLFVNNHQQKAMAQAHKPHLDQDTDESITPRIKPSSSKPSSTPVSFAARNTTVSEILPELSKDEFEKMKNATRTIELPQDVDIEESSWCCCTIV